MPPPTNQTFDDMDDDLFNDIDIDALTQGKKIESKDNRNEVIDVQVASSNSRKFVENFSKWIIDFLPDILYKGNFNENLCKLIGRLSPLLIASKKKVWNHNFYVLITSQDFKWFKSTYLQSRDKLLILRIFSTMVEFDESIVQVLFTFFQKLKIKELTTEILTVWMNSMLEVENSLPLPLLIQFSKTLYSIPLLKEWFMGVFDRRGVLDDPSKFVSYRESSLKGT